MIAVCVGRGVHVAGPSSGQTAPGVRDEDVAAAGAALLEMLPLAQAAPKMAETMANGTKRWFTVELQYERG